ncbi:MAG: hypothetical protein JWO11_871, partial [Nocardioides sp.]|nr:hypothetical protein [Nocardioides sp.]
MTEIERQAVSLLDAATSDLAPDARELADRGVARGRTLRRRRRTTTALCAFAAVGAVGAFGAAVVVPALGGSGAAGRGLDSVPLASQPSAPAPAAPGHPAPRDLGTRAAGVPDVFTSIFPGDVALVPGKENPMDGFDPRSQPLGAGQVDRQGEPGPGVIADFTWNGFYVRAAVAPSDPVWGDTARERCLGEVAGSDAVCEHVAGGGALVSRT